MRAQRKSADFSDMLAMMRALALASASVTGGHATTVTAPSSTWWAWMPTAADPRHCADGQEDGRWKVEKTSMSSGGD